MFCKNCGKENIDGARFCAGCGSDLTVAPAEPVYQENYYQEPVQTAAPVEEAPATSNFDETLNNVKEGAADAFNKAADFSKNYMEEAKKDKKKLIIPIVAVVAVVALLIVLISSLGSGYKGAIDNYMKIANGKITEKNVEKLYPKEFWEETDTDPADVAELLEENYEDGLEELEDEYGKNVKFSYKITDKDKMDKDDLDDLRDYLSDAWGVKKKSVKAAYELEIETTIKGSEDKDSDESDVVVVKIGSKWYVAEGMNF